MATNTPKGIRRISNGDAMNGPTQISNIADDVDTLINPTATTSAALPVTGNWIGRAVYVEDIDQIRYWNGSAWNHGGQGVYIEPAASYFTMNSGWTLNNSQIVYAGPIVTVRMNVTKATTAISGVAGSGNFTNTLIATLTDASLTPVNTVSLSTDNTGSAYAYYILSTGGIYLSAGPPGLGVAIGDSMSFSGTYIRLGV